MRKNVILDTNILVAAGFNRHSHSAQIIAQIRDGALNLVWHRKTKAECERIVRRIPPLDWSAFEDLFLPAQEYTNAIAPDDFSAIPDPEDRKFAALAAATESVLISNDQHLLAEREHLTIVVKSPTEFMDDYSD